MKHELQVNSTSISDKDVVQYVRDLIERKSQVDFGYGALTPEQYRCLSRSQRDTMWAIFHYMDVMRQPFEPPLITEKGLTSEAISPQDAKEALNEGVIERIGTTAVEGCCYQLTSDYYDNWLVRRFRKLRS